ncbi:hypothetical protein [Aromatoleum anaerobium]|uniref:Uncharacterized protein n=1 Tax=Aromatoleum anaerobium TaxID=182180 RepID=A0ABX1PP34_9RHOO|nr:hypothetical protein [Aromatoleum anaerobium]MCK0508638.1 hypothetical protein [Aromatoleum anaerobium]
MNTSTRITGALLVGAIGLLAGLARVVLAFAETEAQEKGAEQDPLGQRAFFGDADDAEGAAYTAYGREPVVAGRNGEPVGAYSGLPIAHY